MASIQNEKRFLNQSRSIRNCIEAWCIHETFRSRVAPKCYYPWRWLACFKSFSWSACGYSLLWLQPMAIILGVIMLSAISHVTLSTGQSPFASINNEINPVLGWGWAVATIMANIVWCLPQFSLGTAAVTQNLLPWLNNTGGKVLICALMLGAAFSCCASL